MRELTCIGCPLGCALRVEVKGEEIAVSGNTCPRGEKYAKAEVTNPVRMVASTVALSGGSIARVPVKTAREVPKARVLDCMAAIRRAKAVAPVRAGDVLIRDCAGTGVDVIATRSIPAAGSLQ